MYTKTCLRAHYSRSKYTLTCKQGDPTLVLLQAERHWAQDVLFVQNPEQEQPGVERTGTLFMKHLLMVLILDINSKYVKHE